MITALCYSAAFAILVAWNIALGRRITARQQETETQATRAGAFMNATDTRLDRIEQELHIRPSFTIRKQRTPDHVS